MKLKKFLKNISFKKVFLVLLLSSLILINLYPLAYAQTNKSSTPNKIVSVDGDKYIVNSWEELKQIIEDGTYNDNNPVSDPNNINIVINGPIGAKSTINISSGKTINLSGQNDAIIYGAADGTINDAKIENYRYGSMFVVDGGTLNTDSNVIFSGKRAIYKDDTCNDNVPVNNQSVVGYIPKDKYDFTNYGEISYTKSVAEEEYDYQYSDLTYSPSQEVVYDDLYKFDDYSASYTPSGQAFVNNTNFTTIKGTKPNYSGQFDVLNDEKNIKITVGGESFWLRGRYGVIRADNTPVSGATLYHWIPDRNGTGKIGIAQSSNPYQYLRYDGTWHDDDGAGTGYQGREFTGKKEYVWSVHSDGGIYCLDSNDNEWFMYRKDDGTMGFVKSGQTLEGKDAGLYINDKITKSPDPSTNNIIVGDSWGRILRIYNAVNNGGDVNNGEEANSLTVGNLYHIQSTNNSGVYWNLAASGTGITYTNGQDPNPGNTFYANTVWEYMSDGTFRNRFPADNENNRVVLYWDGTKLATTTYSNWLVMKNGQNATLKINNEQVYKGSPLTTTSGGGDVYLYVANADGTVGTEATSTLSGDYYIKSGNDYLKNDGTWSSTIDNRSNFAWTYSLGTFSNGVKKLYKDGTNVTVVDSTTKDTSTILTPAANSSLKANDSTKDLFKGDNTAVLKTTGTNYLTLYESNTNSVPTTEAGATLTNGAKYVIKSSDGSYLRGQGSDYTPGWNSNTSTMTWSRFEWTYNSADGTLSHGDYKILVNSDGSVEIVDSTKNKVDAVDPVLKINDTQVYKGNLLSTSSGDPVYLYKIVLNSNNKYEPGEEASSINDGPFYVKAGDQWLKKENTEDAKWDVHPGNSRNYNNSINPYVWEYDSTKKTLTHGDYAIYLDGTNGIVVNKNEKVGDITFGGSIRYATTNSTSSLFTTNGTNSVYMYEVKTDGSKGNHVDDSLTLNKYYYLVTEEDGKYLEANTSGGAWSTFTTQTNQKDNPFAWKYISKKKEDVTYNVLYNEETDQIIYHDGTKLTMAPNTVIHCASKLADRWTPVNKQDSTCPGETNFHHAVEHLPGVNTEKLGYFITAKNKSNINVSGTIFKDLYVGKGGLVKDYAPIVINYSTFNMSSGSIQNNVVGYTADESKSGMQVTGSNQEHASGVKNYLNSKDMTNTAGGIIFTNGAKAQITGESYIKQNKGDVGGILVQGDGTDVTLGARIPDIENDIILDVIGGGHIDQNTGFHHAGAALVENGGLLRMAAPDSTMNNNVTWAKGGAVWATDFGTNGYAIVDYKQKKLVNPEKRQTKQVTENGVTKTVSNAGTFIMKNGTIDNNTAFVRGGGINVESDHVHLLGGTISNNNCRALGGGIYVVGDFPDYTYTLLLNRGYVGHNYSVRYWNLDNFNSTDNDVNGAWDDLSLRELNNRLDRKLGAEDDGTGNPINTNSVFAGQPDGYTNRTADVRDYPRPHEGTGGGIWLCPIGGTAIFNLHDDHEVVVDDNYASGNTSSDNRKGTDIYLHGGTGHILISKDDEHVEDWRNEANNNRIAASKEGEGDVYSGPLYLINATDDATYDERKNKYNSSESEYQAYLADTSNYIGVRIIDNISRDGGGIAADGTLLFGLPTDVYRHEAQLGFKKIWPTNADTYPVTFKMFHYDYITVTENTSSSNPSTLVVKSTELDANGDGLIDSTYTKNGKTYNVPSFYVGKDTLNELSGYEFHLDGIAGNEDDYQKSPETTVPSGTNDTVGGLQANGEHHWTADTTIPVTVEVKDQSDNIVTLPLYTLRYTGETTSVQIPVGGESTTYETVTVRKDEILDPSSDVGMKKIYAIAATNPDKFEVADWNIVIKEYNAAGMEIKEAEFSSITSGEIHITEGYVDVIDAGGIGKKVRGYSINFSEANFSSTAKNGEGPSVEKYINNKVHQDLGIYSESFEYTIMAYVPLDATEVVIEDTLEDALMFVDTNGKEQFVNFGSNNSYKVVTNSDVDLSWVGDFWIWVENDEPGLEAGYYKIIKDERVLSKNSSNVVYNIKSIETTKWSEPGYVKPNNLREYGTFVNGESTSSVSNYVNNSSTTGYDLVIVDKNNHKGNGLPLSDNKSGTVTEHTNIEYFRNHPEQHLNGPINNNTVEIGYYDANNNFVASPDGNTIRVTVTDEMLKGEATGSSNNQVDAHGKWIMLSFDAAIKPEYRDIELLRQKTNGWITEEESKIGSTNLFSELESLANVTINRVLHNEQTGLYYARAKDASGNNHYYIYVSQSPEKQTVIENNTNVETDEYLALHWYEVFYGDSRYYPIDGENKGKNIVLWSATYNGTNAFESRVGANNTVNGLNNSSNTPSIGTASTKEIDFYNYPVIEGQVPHSGVKNQASYTITYPHGGKSNYKTNIVTVDVNQPEKYVNDKVHEILRHDQTAEGAFDQVFEYEIMVYVPDNADEIIIWDTLRDDLMFVDRHGKTQYKTYTIGTSENDIFSDLKDIPNAEFMVRNDDDNAISNDTNNLGVTLVANDGKSIDPENDGNSHQLQYFTTNDHKGDGTGTVSTNGNDINGPITAGNVVIAEAPTGDVTSLPTNNKEGNTIYIKFDESTGINDVKGKWVKVSFFAQIKPTRYVDIVNKLQKSSRHTNDKTFAVDYDASTNLNPTPVGYNYRTTDKTSLKMNAKGYNPNTDTVPDTSKVGYYEKNTETGYFTEFTTTLPSGTEGVDYIQAYESGFVYHASTLNDIPEEVKTKGTSEYEAVYLKKGWNDTDDNISWEKVTDDGNVIDGINLYRNNTTKEAYLDVQADGSHAGLANNAKYAVRFNNEWKYSTTNTVTVVPLLRTITIKKMWILGNEEAIPSAHELLDHLHLYWERITNLDNTQASDHGETVGDITNLYKNHISIVQEKVETITGNTRYTWRIEITDLPQLRPSMKYFIKEDRFDGFNAPRYINSSDPEATEHAHDTGSILNSKDTEDVELLVTKKWDGASESEYQNETIKVQLLENGHYVYKRDNQFRVLDEDGNLVSETGKQPAENLDFTKEINSSEDWFILFDSLPKYQRDNDGNYITEVAYDAYGHVITDDKNNQFYKNILNDYSIKVLSDPDGYILSVVNDYEKVYTYTPTIYPQEAYDFIEPAEYHNRVFDYETFNGNIGYFVYDVYSETVIEDGFPITHTIIDENSAVFYANGDTNRPTINEDSGNPIVACHLLPSTGPSDSKCYREAYYKIDVHKNYKVDLVNTKPQIEKYINKDVHQKGYFSSDITYDILVYVPEEATEIEITDQLLPTLSLISIDEPQLSGNESKEIISYRPISVTTLSEDPNSAVDINLAVHERNNHEIYGTVNSETVSDTVLGKINKDENGFIIKINNIVPASGDYVEYEHGEYVKVRNEAGNTTYIKANEVEYYSVVDGVDATNPISYEGRYVRLRNINNNTYQYVKYSAYLNYPQMLKDSFEIDPANTFYELKEYERIDDSYYRKKNESYYIVDASGDYVKVKDNEIGNIIVFTKPNLIPDGYERLGTEFYSLADSFDQKIGGKYVQVTFTAKLNANGYAEDASGDYVLGSDNNYYLANELPNGVTRVGTKKYSPKEIALQRWIESNESNSTPREDLDWDVITDYGAGVDGNNKGWDNYIKEALVANGYAPSSEYIVSEFGTLIDYLNDNNKTIDVVLKDSDYYLVRDNDGVIYQYRRTDTTAGYAPLIRQWFRVTAPTSGSADNNAAIFYIVGEKAGQQAVKSDNSPYWLGLSWNETQSRFQAYDNGSTSSVLNVVPITPDSYYKIPDENGNDKYYLVDVAELYTKDVLDAAENDAIRKTIYRKVDWGRGDGNVLRNYPNNFSGEQYKDDHAGIVNTSSYEITYGNGYKSNHKSNTVTYVPDIYRLPSSGGSGTYWITLIGSMFTALAAMHLIIDKKRKEGMLQTAGINQTYVRRNTNKIKTKTNDSKLRRKEKIMKKLFKTVSTVLIAVFLVLTSLPSSVSALTGSEPATVTVENLQEKDKVTLYQIVEPNINSSGTLEGYKFVSGAADTLVGPDEKITLTLSDGDKSYTITKKASELDANKDGLIDTKITLASESVVPDGAAEGTEPDTLANKEWNIDATKVGDVVYNMQQPTQQQINLAVSKLDLTSLTKKDSQPVESGKTYAQIEVTAGQYLGIITPSANNKKTYNPVVLSAGYEGLPVYKVADTSAQETATHYKKVNGEYITDAPEKGTVHLYDNAKWDETNNKAVFKETDTTTGVTEGSDYKKLYFTNGITTSDQLIAHDLDSSSTYTWTATGTIAVAKSRTPGISKTHETDTHESDRQVALLAVDKEGNPLVDTDDSLFYIKAPYNKDQYIALLDKDETKKYKWNETTSAWDESSDSDAVGIADIRIKDFKAASTISESTVYTGGQGEEIRYTLTPTIPQYPVNAKNRTFVITDNLSSGLDYVEGSLNMTIDGYFIERDQNQDKSYSFFVYEKSGKINNNNEVIDGEGTYYKNGEVYHPISGATLSEGTDVYTRKEFAKLAEKDACPTLMGSNDNDFQINFTYENLPGIEGAKQSPVITYKGVFTDEAIEGVEGNPNVAKAFYARNTGTGENWDTTSFNEPSGNDYNEWRDVKKVYTYELRFRKTNEKPEYKEDNAGEYYILLTWNEVEASSAYTSANADGKKALEDAWYALTQGDGVTLYTYGEVLMSDDSVEDHYLTKTAPETTTSALSVLYSGKRAKKNTGNTNQADDFTTLAGAVFGVYSDAACTQLVTRVQVGTDGIGYTTKINGGDYWLKEITPPVGYTLSTKVHGPYHVDWTTATVETKETSDRKVYTTDLTAALNVDGDANNANKPVKKPNPTETGVNGNTISDAAGDVILPDQVGWLVGTGTNDKFYENQVFAVNVADSGWTYYEDKTTVGTTTYEAHTMVYKDGTVISNVFRAYLESHTTTSNSGTATYYNNNGGTYDLNRIKNNKNAELPSTGGIGTYAFTIGGVAIIALAAFMLIFRKKEVTK